MATRFGTPKSSLSLTNNLLCPKDLKLAMDKSALSEEDGNKLIEFVSNCSQVEKLVFPNLPRSQRSTFARRLQNLPLRSISFNNKSASLGEVCSMLNQPLKRVSISAQKLGPNDTAQLSRILSKGTVKRLDMIDCTIEDMETLSRGLKASHVTKILIATPTFQNAAVNCSDIIKSLSSLLSLKVTRVNYEDATAALRASAEKNGLNHISVRVDPDDLDDTQMYAITSAMASAVMTNKRITSVGFSIFDSDNLELLTTSISRSKYIKKIALYIEDCTDRVLKLIVPLIALKQKLIKLKLKFTTNLTYDQSTYIGNILNGTQAISNISLANLFPDPILARLCSYGSPIQKLNLKYCKFLSSSMEYIGTIMTNSNTHLEVLDLTGSVIDTDQLEQLTEHVKTLCRRNLKQICVYLNDTDLSKPGEATSVKNFIGSLDKHRTLRKIDLYGACMDEEISKMILNLVANNKIGKFNFDMEEEAENTKMEELEDKINQILQHNRCKIRISDRLEKQIDLAQKIIYQGDRGSFKILPEEIIHHILNLFDDDNFLM